MFGMDGTPSVNTCALLWTMHVIREALQNQAAKSRALETIRSDFRWKLEGSYLRGMDEHLIQLTDTVATYHTGYTHNLGCGSLVTTAWRVLRLRMEETASR
jgi:hypothetical protein